MNAVVITMKRERERERVMLIFVVCNVTLLLASFFTKDCLFNGQTRPSPLTKHPLWPFSNRKRCASPPQKAFCRHLCGFMVALLYSFLWKPSLRKLKGSSSAEKTFFLISVLCCGVFFFLLSSLCSLYCRNKNGGKTKPLLVQLCHSFGNFWHRGGSLLSTWIIYKVLEPLLGTTSPFEVIICYILWSLCCSNCNQTST